MNGCTYIDKKTGEPVAWTENYNSGIMKNLLEKRVDIIITEEQYYMYRIRQCKYLVEEGIL